MSNKLMHKKVTAKRYHLENGKIETTDTHGEFVGFTMWSHIEDLQLSPAGIILNKDGRMFLSYVQDIQFLGLESEKSE